MRIRGTSRSVYLLDEKSLFLSILLSHLFQFNSTGEFRSETQMRLGRDHRLNLRAAYPVAYNRYVIEQETELIRSFGEQLAHTLRDECSLGN